MTFNSNPIILIPCRMNSTRLPNKPLADINGVPMIVRVWQIAVKANLGRVIVACGEPEISEVIKNEGGEAILTDPDLPSGSDRIFAALEEVDPSEKHDIVINLQGDLPLLERSTITATFDLLQNERVDIGTAAAKITVPEEKLSPSIVKAIVAWNNDGITGRSLYFTRAPAPAGDGPMYHHIGLYTFRRRALERFVKLPMSSLERQERLEQLRALENGMRIDVALVDTVPFGVDTPEDLEKAKILIK